jgi:hypothetical protein
MRKIQRIRIDDLAVAGHELTEAHLALAAGGATRMTSRGVAVTCADGGRLLDPIED